MSAEQANLWRLTLELGDPDLARRAAAHLTECEELGAMAVALFDDKCGGLAVEAWVASPLDPETLAAALELPAARITAGFACERVEARNWVAISQAALPPVAAGRFVVHGSHDRIAAGGHVYAIEIDAGEAFGTAHHATTSGCLMAIDRLASGPGRPRSVLDLGSGAGTLAIAAARVWPQARIMASDSDPVAVAVARANAMRNRVGARVRPICAVGFAHPHLRQYRAFDLVIANILAEPLIRLARRIAWAVRPGGRVVLSGLLVTQSRQVKAVYRAAGFALARERHLHGWAIVELVHGG